MSCTMFREIGRHDYPLHCGVGEREITNAQTLSRNR